MSEQDKAQAAEHASRAATQARHSVKNAARAASNGASVVADEASDVAGDVTDTAKDTIQNLDARRIAFVASDLGVGFLALSASIGAAIIATRRFHDVWEARP